ncbi:hypothetical protein D3C75_1301530 [compost metagenome]
MAPGISQSSEGLRQASRPLGSSRSISRLPLGSWVSKIATAPLLPRIATSPRVSTIGLARLGGWLPRAR